MRVAAALLLLFGALACQVRSVEIVDCRSDTDCETGEVCAPDRRCVPSSPYVATELSWNDQGEIDADSNPFGIRGRWFLASDCAESMAAIAAGTYVCPPDPPTPGCCTALDPAYPGIGLVGTEGARLVPASNDAPAKACIKGITPQLLNDTSGNPAYGANWGIVFAMALNDNMPFDATKAYAGGPVVGFSLDLEAATAGTPVRVEIEGNDRTYGYGADLVLPVSTVTLALADSLPPEWVTDAPAIDLHDLTTLALKVGTDTTAPTPFDFCLSDLRVLQARGEASR